jgi:phosphate transport system protein
MTEHISKQYDQDLEAIRSRALQMGGLVESQVKSALSGYLTGDAERIDAAIASDAKVNELEVALDDDLRTVIVRRQPAASDLRLIMAVSKTVTDLERIGDEATKIARMAREIHGIPSKGSTARLTMINHVSEVSTGMLRRSLDSFARLDPAAAARVIGEDKMIDEEFHAIVRQLITFMMEDPRNISASINVIWVAKAIERIGDHAKNIAEQTIYIVKGTDVRHTPLAEVEREALS